jgi:hypothetical protein
MVGSDAKLIIKVLIRMMKFGISLFEKVLKGEPIDASG